MSEQNELEKLLVKRYDLALAGLDENEKEFVMDFSKLQGLFR